MKGVVCTDKLIEKNHSTLQFLGSIEHFSIFSPLFWLYSPLVKYIVSGSSAAAAAFSNSLFSSKKTVKPVHHLFTKQQTDKFIDWPVNISEHLAAIKPDISLMSGWRVKQSLKESEH